MLITIEHLIPGEVRQIGFTPMPAYRVIFAAGPLRAGAWFVPSTEDVSHFVGQECEVEVNQERVRGLWLVSPSEPLTHGLTALSEFACFQVWGQVELVLPGNARGGEPIAYIKAGEATIAIAGDELLGLELNAGEVVALVAHDVSLWDEAI